MALALAVAAAAEAREVAVPLVLDHELVRQALIEQVYTDPGETARVWDDVVQGGQIVALRSPVGSIGIMQVNQSVWRGFYDLGGLRRDIRYNLRAGAEISSQYLRRYVLGGAGGTSTTGSAGGTGGAKDGGSKDTGGGGSEKAAGGDPGGGAAGGAKRGDVAGAEAVEIAGATYAVYNGGPGQLRRLRKGRSSARERAVDRSFRDKLARIRDGDALAVRECFGD